MRRSIRKATVWLTSPFHIFDLVADEWSSAVYALIVAGSGGVPSVADDFR
jgi:hypothetical protein